LRSRASADRPINPTMSSKQHRQDFVRPNSYPTMPSYSDNLQSILALS
jgi:hypothetical protein